MLVCVITLQNGFANLRKPTLKSVTVICSYRQIMKISHANR